MGAPKQTYCSLDLELTGFDPALDEILEVGFVFFTVENGVPVMLEQWSQVFKPSREVRSKILALTGIPRQEVENASRFSEFKDFLESKLSDCILVGHSIGVDIRFLEAFGVKTSGKYIDTLDLVQFLLPTHHSYNLENLMHYFSVPHPEAHRALEDAKATVVVIGKLLEKYTSFPHDLQLKLWPFIQKGQFLWTPLFEGLVSSENLGQPESSLESVRSGREEIASIETGTITHFPLNQSIDLELAKASRNSESSLLVFSRSKRILDFYKRGLVEPLFPPDEIFNSERFQRFSSKSSLDPVEILFILKILVWQHTNWQTRTLLDVNWSVSGRQFKSFITGDQRNEALNGKAIGLDYATFLNVYQNPLYGSRQLVIESIDAFEEFLTEELGVQVSWNKIVSILKSFYNPETGAGDSIYAASISGALAATDLFFGLVRLLFKGFQGNVDVNSLDPYTYNKLSRAADHYKERLRLIGDELRSPSLEELIKKFDLFFKQDSGLVKWIEVSDTRCGFFARPLSLAGAMKGIRQHYPSLSFVTNLAHERLINNFAARLSVTDLKKQYIVPPNPQKVSVFIGSKALAAKEIVSTALIQTPSLVVFNTQEELRNFYDAQFIELKMAAKVFALGYSGGPTKMLRNFAISDRSVMLATANFLARQASSSIKVKHALFISPPTVDIVHPYALAEANAFPQGVEEYKTIKLWDTLYSIIRLCDITSLERVTFAHVPDNSSIKEFILELPGFNINEY